MPISPLVSVIIPNYNHARYLSARLDSVLFQSYSNIEVIILDDYSLDNSRDIIEKYASSDSRISVFYNDENSGSTFKQWNKGFALANGDYIWIAESDDESDLFFLQKAVSKLENISSIGLVYCQSWCIDENGVRHGTWAQSFDNLDSYLWLTDFVLPGKELVSRFMVYNNIIPNASSVVMRKSAILQLPPADESTKLVGDWIFWIRYLMNNDIAFLAEPLNYFRFHTNSTRSKTERDGTQLVELAKVVNLVNNLVTPNPFWNKKTINWLIQKWLHGLVYYRMPIAKHKQFLQLMSALIPNFKYRLAKDFAYFLIRNKFSGVKMLIGDRLVNSLLKIKD
ncbi:glycosyltransferase family 2 protein [Hymenobacter rubidus]|uniref:glycosyltransferase family 2 protein n=1 Tax=Hymenobacter rubidus TaxID=1441626 RepID=UPI00191DF93D|nr:glycosyltransferase [Hymenobacter rubidus]